MNSKFNIFNLKRELLNLVYLSINLYLGFTNHNNYNKNKKSLFLKFNYITQGLIKFFSYYYNNISLIFYYFYKKISLKVKFFEKCFSLLINFHNPIIIKFAL